MRLKFVVAATISDLTNASRNDLEPARGVNVLDMRFDVETGGIFQDLVEASTDSH